MCCFRLPFVLGKAVNTERETIELASASSSAVGDFTKVISEDAPRFSFFVFNRV